MSPAVLVGVADYLSNTYRPDCEFVDGELLERNVGEKDQGKLQFQIAKWFDGVKRQCGVAVFIEQRIRISANRYRVPDICVCIGPEPAEQVFTQPPFICIEILSPRDTLSSMQERIDDYLAFGVAHVWLVDPKTKRGGAYSDSGSRETKDGFLRAEGSELALPLHEIFVAMDED